jgi:Tol biopolymer transport system component
MSQPQPRVYTRDDPSAPLVRDQLIRILSSEIFSRSDRLSAFLKFIVEQTLNGHGDTLKEQVIAAELYGKGPDFSTAEDPIVRVDARRLRDHLREYYASAPNDPVVILVPKGSYTPVFEVHSFTGAAPAAGAAVRIEPRLKSPHRFWAAGAVVVLIGAIAWIAIGTGSPSAPPVRLLQVTSFPGSEGGPPAVSPDGNFVAFGWTGPDFTADGDLWVKAVDGDALRRLTDTPHMNEVYPAWSPDGRQIAFVRIEGEANRGIYVISSLGGPERKVSDSGFKPTWLPDSQSLVFEDRTAGSVAPVQLVLATGARRQLTTPPAGFVDITPKVSPDGKSVAFVRTTPERVARIGYTMVAGLFVVPMAGGDPVRLDDRASGLGGPEWTPDGREVLYPRWDPGGVKIFRIAATGGAAAPATGLPMGAYSVSISGFRPGGTFRVALVDARSDVGLRMIDLHAPQTGGQISAWTAFCDSTRIDWPGRFSRDGAQVSFTSDRNGLPQIFAANRDGSRLRTLTAFDGSSVGLASWSPDGQFLVFDAVDRNNVTDLYVVHADGGSVRRLTNDNQREVNPEWSRDGRWIYYASDTLGRSEIWKIPTAGGTPVQLTTQGGMDPRESSDGRSVYFLEPPPGRPTVVATTLKRVSVDGGGVSTVLSGVRLGRWDVTDTGIVFLTGALGITPDPATPDALEFYSVKDDRTRRLGELPFPVTSRGYSPPRVLTVSPDGRWVVVSHMDHWERDIVLADNFR